MVIATVFFALSVVGITALFSLKYWETRRGTVLAPALRARADVRAEHFKGLLLAARADLSKLPPEAMRIGHIIVHEIALALAAFARALERQAHRLADMVSHKRGFERRETRSDFLKKVSEHKNGTVVSSVEELDTTDGNGHNI